MRFIRHARFLRQSALLQPIKQGVTETSDDTNLRKMDVSIDEPGQQKAAAEIGGCGFGVGVTQAAVIAACGNTTIANQQAAIQCVVSPSR